MPDARGNVHIRMSAEDANLWRAFDRARKDGIGGLADEFSKLGNKSQKSGKQAQSSLAGVTMEAIKAAAGFAGVGSVISGLTTLASVLRNELAEIERLQVSSGRAQLSVGNAQRRAMFALGVQGVDTDLSIEDVTEQLKNSRSGVPLETLLDVFTAASSSKGSLSAQQALDTVLATAKLRPDLPVDDLKTLATAAVALQKAYQGTTPQETVAGVQQSLLAARTEEIGALARNMIPAIAQSRSYGGDKDRFEYLASLFIGVGQRSEDPTGRRTATNTLKFLEQIQTLAISRGIVAQDSTVENTLKVLRTGEAGSDAERLRQELVGVFNKNLEEIPTELQEFGKGALLSEAKTRVALLEILDRNSDNVTWREIRSAQDKIAGLNERAVQLMEKQLSVLQTLPEQMAAENSRAIEQALQRIRAEDPTGITGLTNEQMKEVMQRTGSSAIRANIDSWLRTASAPGKTQSQQIDSQIRELTDQRNRLESWRATTRRDNVADDALSLMRKYDPLAKFYSFGYDMFRSAAESQQSKDNRINAIEEIDTVIEELKKQRERIAEPADPQIEYVAAGVNDVNGFAPGNSSGKMQSRIDRRDPRETFKGAQRDQVAEKTRVPGSAEGTPSKELAPTIDELAKQMRRWNDRESDKDKNVKERPVTQPKVIRAPEVE